MWRLINRTPYPADRAWVRDLDGAEIWTVAVKASFDFDGQGRLTPSTQPSPIHAGPVPLQDSQGLRYDTDLGPRKPATDIVLHGHAYAQNAQPCEQLPVGFQVGPLRRLAMIHGDRVLTRHWYGTRTSPAQPFTRMPLTYERSYGGDAPGSENYSGNPLGCGAVLDPQGRSQLPNIEPLPPLPDRATPPQRVIGFGPIDPAWPARLRHAGTYDENWQQTRYPLSPRDLDARFWQIAPPEQQVPGYLKGGEEIVLLNLTPPGFAAKGRVGLRLPKITLAFQTHFFNGEMMRSRAVIHTLILEPDEARISLVYHMTLPCHALVNQLDRTLILQKRRPLDREPGPVNEETLWPDASHAEWNNDIRTSTGDGA